MKTWLISGAIGGLLLWQAHPAHAYWDDVHYHLTYFTARLAGCTPEQSYRLAAADVSTDYSPATEPTQFDISEYTGTGRGDAPAKQEPRWRYHAFRNQTVPDFKDSVGNGPGAAAADEAIKKQANELFAAGTRTRNIGVFLHFAQDREPHRGFGSAWGHYFDPKDPAGSTQQARAANLRLGGMVDWISAHPKLTTLDLMYNTGSWIDKFLATASPHQHRRAVTLAESEGMIDALRGLSPAPDPLTLAELPLYQQFVESSMNPLATAPTLTPQQLAKFTAHKNGPNLSGAEGLIVAEMKRLGMVEGGIPALAQARHQYTFSAQGNPQGDGIRVWGIVANLKLTVQGNSASDTEPVDVTIKAPITMTGETEYEIYPVTEMKPGEAHTFETLPVGNVIVEVQRKGKTLVKSNASILEPVNEVTLKLPKSGLTGMWTTDTGWTLTLTQTDDKVAGNYHGDGVTGTVAGTFDGKVFAGAYTHNEGGATYKGTFSAKLVGDDKLDGTWTETEHGVTQNIVATRGK